MYYDSMIAKVITKGKNRAEALKKMTEALDSMVIRGVTHNVCFLREVVVNPQFAAGTVTTNFIAEQYPEGFLGHQLSNSDKHVVLSSAAAVYAHSANRKLTIEDGVNDSFDADGLLEDKLKVLHVTMKPQVGPVEKYILRLCAEDYEDPQSKLFIHIAPNKEGVAMSSAGKVVELATEADIEIESDYDVSSPVFNAYVNGHKHVLQPLEVGQIRPTVKLSFQGTEYSFEFRTPREAELLQKMPISKTLDLTKTIISPMPGAVSSVAVEVGQKVAPGMELLVIEAMKMQNAINCQRNGTVKKVHIKQGQTVQTDQVLIEME
jgi:propionyl-CoA carboxylase alpha chain